MLAVMKGWCQPVQTYLIVYDMCHYVDKRHDTFPTPCGVCEAADITETEHADLATVASKSARPYQDVGAGSVYQLRQKPV